MAKKYMTSLLLALFILTGPYQAVQASPIVIFNGNILSFNVPPVVENGKLLVPLRPIFEAIGASVSWDNDTKTVTAIKGTNSIKITIGISSAAKNGQSVYLDTPAKIINGTTFVPVRFVSEAMDCSVNWVEEYQVAIITDDSFDSANILDLKKSIEGRIVPSGSMLPTINLNDRVLIDKHIYSVTVPQRGDIVLLLPPAEIKSSEMYIKRIVAVPGDTVEIKNGQLYLNQQIYNEPYILEPMAYEYGPITVPADGYFVLGDNRNSSFDSHLWAACFVPKQSIIGKAQSIYWPAEHQKSL